MGGRWGRERERGREREKWGREREKERDGGKKKRVCVSECVSVCVMEIISKHC